MIEAQEGIDFAIIEITSPTAYPDFAKTGEVVSFMLKEHSGNLRNIDTITINNISNICGAANSSGGSRISR